MDATSEGIVVEREIEIAARPETVWGLLTDPDEAIRWMGQAASFDLRPGGAWRLDVLPGNVASGAFVVIDPPRRLVYTWGWESGSASSVAPGSTTVEFELVPREGGTLLRLRHELPDAVAAGSHEHGWNHYLERLATVAAGGDPGVDPWLSGTAT